MQKECMIYQGKRWCLETAEIAAQSNGEFGWPVAIVIVAFFIFIISFMKNI